MLISRNAGLPVTRQGLVDAIDGLALIYEHSLFDTPFRIFVPQSLAQQYAVRIQMYWAFQHRRKRESLIHNSCNEADTRSRARRETGTAPLANSLLISCGQQPQCNIFDGLSIESVDQFVSALLVHSAYGLFPSTTFPSLLNR